MKTFSDYTIYCTEEQTKKALDLDAPIIKAQSRHDLYNNRYCFVDGIEPAVIIPTAEQMIGWLRSKGMKFYFNDTTNFCRVVIGINILMQGYSNTKELAVIDAALDYLINKKK